MICQALDLLSFIVVSSNGLENDIASLGQKIQFSTFLKQNL